jgi:hypothetical protein
MSDASIPSEFEDWLLSNKEAIKASLDVTIAQAERGEGYSLEECEAMMAEHRAARRGK